MAWVELPDLKADLGIDEADDRDDERLQVMLDAALAFAARVRPEFNWDEESGSDSPDPTNDVRLGVIRLAGRWHTRRRSPDALIDMGELGAARVPSFDPDIERLLGIGKYRGPVVA